MTNRAFLPARCAYAYHRYGRACDNHDLEALRALAVDDVQFSITGPVVKHGHGIEAFLDLYRAHDPRVATRHVISGVLAEQDGVDIRTHAHFEATVFGASGTRITYGVYRNVLRESGDGTLLIVNHIIQVERRLELPATVAVDPTVSPRS
ncbi:nuclear transport factor 2 family protein [Amycolatopsis pithecellobii]|uniref:SnoaL-like domain-containing protein n=1 Tax=Amycolatopsis pithecellobii TaxID=664692 RepID=A0A6N7Z4X8_9PSEU|nr:nuclear transport factor 2 family protein [Amycolatopsis pithecellobii]MTD55621.1 hypothetical protein [Amycolatopsis pithecellobii]